MQVARGELAIHPLPEVEDDLALPLRPGWEVAVMEAWQEEMGWAVRSAGAHFTELGPSVRRAGSSRPSFSSPCSIVALCRDCTFKQSTLADAADAGGEFGELLGPLSPVELLKRPRLRAFAVHLQHELGDYPGGNSAGDDVDVADGTRPSRLKGAALGVTGMSLTVALSHKDRFSLGVAGIPFYAAQHHGSGYRLVDTPARISVDETFICCLISAPFCSMSALGYIFFFSDICVCEVLSSTREGGSGRAKTRSKGGKGKKGSQGDPLRDLQQRPGVEADMGAYLPLHVACANGHEGASTPSLSL
ncbi:hypothetical protein CYMTET_50901 [Cymbomonas tetramitiformis]|uniref:Uncharacterized protein n=1 Tax=Cymbomonas tetramitiformis TaxID=36881 RepID=A0AAE0EUA7_9CHLO|nr:hypothetical protein CYMTET_50901 [Cymbomonas tetramitiformis]